MRSSRSLLVLVAALLVVLAVLPAAAQGNSTYYVIVTNITRHQIFKPVMAVSHDHDVHVWELGQPVSPAFAQVAEDAIPGDLEAELDATPGVTAYAISEVPLPPGKSVVLELPVTTPFDKITVFGMLVTTNDAFFGLQAADLPYRRMKDSHLAPAYDAGSEENNELCEFIPGPPCDNLGVRHPDGAEGFVHVHSGIFGIGDLSASTWDWRNPVARVQIQVKQ